MASDRPRQLEPHEQDTIEKFLEAQKVGQDETDERRRIERRIERIERILDGLWEKIEKGGYVRELEQMAKQKNVKIPKLIDWMKADTDARSAAVDAKTPRVVAEESAAPREPEERKKAEDVTIPLSEREPSPPGVPYEEAWEREIMNQFQFEGMGGILREVTFESWQESQSTAEAEAKEKGISVADVKTRWENEWIAVERMTHPRRAQETKEWWRLQYRAYRERDLERRAQERIEMGTSHPRFDELSPLGVDRY